MILADDTCTRAEGALHRFHIEQRAKNDILSSLSMLLPHGQIWVLKTVADCCHHMKNRGQSTKVSRLAFPFCRSFQKAPQCSWISNHAEQNREVGTRWKIKADRACYLVHVSNYTWPSNFTQPAATRWNIGQIWVVLIKIEFQLPRDRKKRAWNWRKSSIKSSSRRNRKAKSTIEATFQIRRNLDERKPMISVGKLPWRSVLELYF